VTAGGAPAVSVLVAVAAARRAVAGFSITRAGPFEAQATATSGQSAAAATSHSRSADGGQMGEAAFIGRNGTEATA
jgi:hypothetical protein